jgi:HD domain-containing protein
VKRAALVHDLRAIGVSAGVWDKPGTLPAAGRERVCTHPYLTERILARPARLAEIGAPAGLHHERLDGSGYPRAAAGNAPSASRSADRRPPLAALAHQARPCPAIHRESAILTDLVRSIHSRQRRKPGHLAER